MELAALVPLINVLAPFGQAGIKLIGVLIQKAETGGTVSSTEWAALMTDAAVTSEQKMLTQLKAAGIDPASPQGVSMLAQAK